MAAKWTSKSLPMDDDCDRCDKPPYKSFLFDQGSVRVVIRRTG